MSRANAASANRTSTVFSPINPTHVGNHEEIPARLAK